MEEKTLDLIKEKKTKEAKDFYSQYGIKENNSCYSAPGLKCEEKENISTVRLSNSTTPIIII